MTGDYKGVLKKRAARTCAIIRVWDYPNKPDLAKVVPIRIGTLLAKFWNRPSVHCSPVTEAITVPDENLHTLTSMPCLPSTERLAKQDVDGWNRQPLSGVLTVQIRIGIFVSVLKMDLGGIGFTPIRCRFSPQNGVSSRRI